MKLCRSVVGSGRRRPQLAVWTLCTTTALVSLQIPVSAQDVDVLSSARTAAESGRRSDALSALERHLAERSADVDARLLYGLVLSWEMRYDDARVELRRVLATAPEYLDARVALMNVEWWSGRHQDAREIANTVLAVDPGNPQARLVRDRLDAADRPWSVQFAVSHDRFSDDRDNWHEETLTLSRKTPAGVVIGRASRANRFSLGDEQIELEFYPVFRSGTYAFVGVGVSPDHRLYARNRLAFDFYQNVGKGVELSGGYRRLAFDDATYIYLGSIAKYVGNWMFSAKMYRVPSVGSSRSTSAHVGVRRYFGTDGTSFVGTGYSRGLVREEVRSTADLIATKADIVRGEFDVAVSPVLRLHFNVSTGRERRPQSAFWQHTVSGGALVRF